MYKSIMFNLTFYFIAGINLVFPFFAYSKDINENKQVDIIRFDAILELNAKYLGTTVLLFARYWVAPDFYNISINWAEPYIGNMNFPTNPIGLSISSNENIFSIYNQFIENHNVSFSKPFGDRGVFRHSLNNYPFDNIRFAEEDAISSRIYKDDLKNTYEPNNSKRQTVDIKNEIQDNSKIRRNLSKLDITINNDIIKDLFIYDNNGVPLKGIEYQYSTQNGKSLLKKQTALLPESRLMVGYNGKGATITLYGEKHTFKELPGYHHIGGRECLVDYKVLKMDNNDISVPYNITVNRLDNNLMLRSAKLSNFVCLKMNADDIERESKLYGIFNDTELNIKNLYEKYWLKNNIEIDDINTISKLRKDIEDQNNLSDIVSENIKYIVLLMQLDYLENKSLIEDFSRYLTILEENNLKKTILDGGIQIIGITAQWEHYSDADQLLSIWLKYVNNTYTPDEIFEFCVNQQKQRYYWIINCILDSYLKSKNNLGEKRFEIEALRIITLNDFLEIIEGKSKTKTPVSLSQIAWAKASNNQDLLKLMKDSIIEASDLYNKLSNPSSNQRMLKNKLIAISK